MHHHLEIITPPVANIETAIKQILAKFDEQGEDKEGNSNTYAFWDWYVIGGRWAGRKLVAGLDQEKIRQLHEEFSKRGVTVSGLQAGKQELSPASQIPMVDALWREYFPESPFKICPLFNHFNDKYKNSEGFPDIMPLKDIPKDLTAARVIIAGEYWNDPTRIDAKFMISDSEWNGVNFVDSKWDGTIKQALEIYKEKIENYKDEYKEKHTPKDDWLVVTIDYHN